MLRRLSAFILLVALSATLACSRQRDRCPEDTTRAVDPVLLSFLSRARAAHHAADVKEGARDQAGAIRQLEGLVSGPLPSGPDVRSEPPEVREVIADTRARLADLRSQIGAYDAAREDVDVGLRYAVEPSYFRGHLFEVRGLVEERHAKTLEATQPEAARAGKEKALAAFEEAMRIQAEVIRRAAPANAPH